MANTEIRGKLIWVDKPELALLDRIAKSGIADAPDVRELARILLIVARQSNAVADTLLALSEVGAIHITPR